MAELHGREVAGDPEQAVHAEQADPRPGGQAQRVQFGREHRRRRP
jgi:hypothetical protein